MDTFTYSKGFCDIAVHRGAGGPIQPGDVVQWSEREHPIQILRMAPQSWEWTMPISGSPDRVVHASKYEQEWGLGYFQRLTQEEIDAWWGGFRLSEGWHELNPRPEHPSRVVGKVYVDKAGDPVTLQWINGKVRCTLARCVQMAEVLTGYEIHLDRSYEDMTLRIKPIASTNRLPPPCQRKSR